MESTTMRSVGYGEKNKVLEIEFESGEIYQYFEVQQNVVEGLLRAESKGRYFNGEIRDEYEWVRVGASRRAAPQTGCNGVLPRK